MNKTSEAPSLSVSARAVGVPAGQLSTVLTVDPSRRSCAIVNIGTVPLYITGDKITDPAAAFYLAVGAGYNWTSQAACFAFGVPGSVTDGALSTIAEAGTAQ